MISNLIEFNIDRSVTASIKLKDLIKNKTGCGFDSTDLRLRVIIKSGIRLDLIDDTVTFESFLSSGQFNHNIEFVLESGCSLFYAYHLKPIFDSEYNQAVLQELGDCNSSLIKQLNFNLIGTDAHAKVRIRALAMSNQRIKFQTQQNHLHENTSSCLCVKTVLFDSAKIECDNKISVSNNACKVFANQMNRNLMIGADAHVISQPNLEILNDDVKCHHGVATRTIDDEQLFYLQNRGIDSVVAKQLLIKGFLG